MTESPERADTTRFWWWIASAVLVVAAVAVTLVLTTGHAGGGENDARDRATTSTASRGYDLSTPETAAESFAAAAATGSGDTLLTLSCVGHLPCVHEHAADLAPAELTDARTMISENAYELAHHLDGAEFAPAVEGDVPGSRDVPYRTPTMTGDTALTLTFVQSDGEWLYLGPTT